MCARCNIRYVLGVRVDATNYESALRRILSWAQLGESRAVYEVPVHSIMESHDDPAYREIINRADLVTPGGMPIVWALRRLGVAKQPRVYGPELMLKTCAMAAEVGTKVGFYGGSEHTLVRLVDVLKGRSPSLDVGYSYSPPFRPLSRQEDEQVERTINASGCRILFVGLGCPKQERWIASKKGRIRAVMLGVGAGFDFISGTKPWAPSWMQRAGLEWLFRLATEPRRLFFRYAWHNPRFVALMAAQLLMRSRDQASCHAEEGKESC